MAAAANAGDKAAANAALALVIRAAANRRALPDINANANLNRTVAAAKASATRAAQVAKTMKEEANRVAAARVKANREAAAAAAKAAAEANKAARAAAAAAAAAKAVENARSAAAAAAAEKRARNAAAAQAKAEANAAKAAANAAKAAKNAQAAKIREFVLKLWPLTKGNTNRQTGVWTPRIKNNAELTQRLKNIKGDLSEANIAAIKNNINRAMANKKIGYWGRGLLERKNANLNNRIKEAKWIVNLGLGQQPTPQAPWRAVAAQREAAAGKIAQAWRGHKSQVRTKILQNTVKATQDTAARVARMAAQPPVGGTRAGSLFARQALLNQWNRAAPGGNIKAKSTAIFRARSAPGTAPTGLGFRQLSEFFSGEIRNETEANAATMAFYDHAAQLAKIGKKWNGLLPGTRPPGPKNSPGGIPRNDLVNYFKIIGKMNAVEAARAANYYYGSP